MSRIPLGTQGFVTSAQGFGAMSIGLSFGPYDVYGKRNLTQAEVTQLVKGMIKAGCTHIDTAQIYCHVLRILFPNACSCLRHSEALLAEGIAAVGRENVEVCTKVSAATKGFGTKENVIRMCEHSLRRMRISHLDLYYMHRIDQATPIEFAMDGMKELIGAGKVKHVGLSEASATTIRRAHAVCKLTCVQVEWSLWARDVEAEIIPTCRELGIGVVAYAPLGRGLLGGDRMQEMKRLDWRRFGAGTYLKAGDASGTADALASLAASKGVHTATLALAWLHKHSCALLGGAGCVPIPGTSKLNHLISNMEAVSLASQLDDADMRAIEAAVPKGALGAFNNDPTQRYSGGKGTWAADQNITVAAWQELQSTKKKLS